MITAIDWYDVNLSVMQVTVIIVAHLYRVHPTQAPATEFLIRTILDRPATYETISYPTLVCYTGLLGEAIQKQGS